MANTRKTTTEKVISIKLADLYPIQNHPIKMREDDSFRETVESVKERGILTPATVRPREAGGYEIIDGRRRKVACELAELPTLPCIVRELDDDAAVITMVDSNIHRDEILPSERAAAYKMKMEACPLPRWFQCSGISGHGSTPRIIFSRFLGSMCREYTMKEVS